MKRVFAVLTILSLATGAMTVTMGASASQTHLFPPNQNEGASN
jgi:hypothetical protein